MGLEEIVLRRSCSFFRSAVCVATMGLLALAGCQVPTPNTVTSLP